MGCSDGWNTYSPAPAVKPLPPMTPRERDYEQRIAELEQVVSKIAKVIWYDDTMTEGKPFVVADDQKTTLTQIPELVRLTRDNEKLTQDKRRLLDENTELQHDVESLETQLRHMRKAQQRYFEFVAAIKDEISDVEEP